MRSKDESEGSLQEREMKEWYDKAEVDLRKARLRC